MVSYPFDDKLKVIAEMRHQLEHHNIHHSTIEMANMAH
jgi:cobalt-zinc-cadmium efflux system protein